MLPFLLLCSHGPNHAGGAWGGPGAAPLPAPRGPGPSLPDSFSQKEAQKWTSGPLPLSQPGKPGLGRRESRDTTPPPHLLGLVNGLEVGGHHLSCQPTWGLTTSQAQPRLCPHCALLLAGRWFIDAHTHVPRMVKAGETAECPVSQRRPISHGQVTAVCCGSLSSVPSGSPKHPLSTLPSPGWAVGTQMNKMEGSPWRGFLLEGETFTL